ncbi:MAG TPA: beta-propeller fold lactonase family protein [Galbitalea sp.]
MSASRIWVGGYTQDMNGSAEGIGLLRVAADGSLEDHGVAAAADSPSYLTRFGDMLYAAGEGAKTVSGYRVLDDELHFAGVQDVAGEYPCSLAVLGDGALLAVACYGNGVIDVHPLGPDGHPLKTGQTLRGEGKGSRINQDGPHAHDILQVDASTVLTTDLGTDDVYVHALDGDLLARIGSVKLPTGSGPRDLFLHPSGVVWVLAELSNELYVLERGAAGFAVAASVPLPGSEEGDHAAAIALSDDGRYAYVGLRGTDRVSVLAVSSDGRTLTPVGSVGCGGGWPRHLVIDGPYLRVANQLTNQVVTFTLADDGLPVKHSTLVVPSPTYLLVD